MSSFRSSLIVMNDSFKGLLLIFLAILCNFIGDTMNCHIQRSIQQYTFIKWVIILGLIYFTINFTSSSNTNPSWLLLYSLIILIIFILFMKQYHVTFYISIVLLLGIFSLNQYLVYYKNLEQQEEGNVGKYDTLIRRIEFTLVSLGITLVILLVIGNIIYLQKQRKEFPTNFNWITFYFGASPCGYLKVNPSNSSQKRVTGVVDGGLVPGTAGLNTLEGNTLHTTV